jgi:hypothetical protein
MICNKTGDFSFYLAGMIRWISIHTKALATVIFLGLVFTILIGLLHLPTFLGWIFPIYIWSKVAVTNGSYFAVFASITLLIVYPILLFVWGYLYPKRQHYSFRLIVLIVLFAGLLGYTFITTALIHLSPLFSPGPPPPPGIMPLDYEARDHMISAIAQTPGLFTKEFLFFCMILFSYCIETFYIYRLLAKARKV